MNIFRDEIDVLCIYRAVWVIGWHRSHKYCSIFTGIIAISTPYTAKHSRYDPQDVYFICISYLNAPTDALLVNIEMYFEVKQTSCGSIALTVHGAFSSQMAPLVQKMINIAIIL